jgi:predicted transcriptional regulator
VKKVIKLDQKKKNTEAVLYWKCFGQFLMENRLRSGLSINEAAEYLGITPQTVKKYEAGQQKVPLNVIYSLSNCLNIAPKAIASIINNYPNFPKISAE